MINFHLGPVQHILSEIGLLVHLASHNQKHAETIPNAYSSPEYFAHPKQLKALTDSKEMVSEILAAVEKHLGPLKAPHIEAAASGLRWWARDEDNAKPEWSGLWSNSTGLRDAITTELRQYFYYQYPKEKAAVLRTWKEDWKAAVAAFPSIEWNAYRATDCYGLQHNDACVFYCMRVLEVGLKAVAADVGLIFELQQWHNIIDQIESKISDERRSLPKGTARNERLQFLSEAAKEFFYFKEGWRNHVSHNRADYDEYQAISVLTHVRAFMNHLASNLSEAGDR